MKIWQGQFLGESFCKLRLLKIRKCHDILVVIPSNVLPKLHNLEELHVSKCNSVKEFIIVEVMFEKDLEALGATSQLHLQDYVGWNYGDSDDDDDDVVNDDDDDDEVNENEDLMRLIEIGMRGRKRWEWDREIKRRKRMNTRMWMMTGRNVDDNDDEVNEQEYEMWMRERERERGGSRIGDKEGKRMKRMNRRTRMMTNHNQDD
ncbi:hypothetical protein CK203_006997 [Vitis vinifera]|uniref:Disease resistance protein At4g27190-like leucine-rich repeats domain-containing protein n=1 Tax=Vitis vinifera TaxID=29760 RepID=A0A438KCE9_VITVI|nr:hypothetical protein CK203_006997 [Vitis vinifera]